MKLSIDRILTTSVGSLQRSAAVTDVLLSKERGERCDRAGFVRVIRDAVIETVARQVATGVDVVSGGKTAKIVYATYIKDPLADFGGENTAKPHRDLREHPNLRERMTAFTGPQTFKRFDQCASRTTRQCARTS